MKKGQAAMEFLMTYGWAILVVLLAIAALAYFGVLNPGRYLPASCNLPSGLACVDHKVVGGADSEVVLVIRNGMGENLDPFNVSVEGCTSADGPVEAIEGLSDGEEEIITISCTEDLSGTKFSGDITVQYTKESGIDHTVTGSITSQIQ